jgi:hypothetical protein
MELCIFRSGLPPYEMHTIGFEINDLYSITNKMQIAYVYRNPLTKKVMLVDSFENFIEQGES